MPETLVLGIDPGMTVTGVGIVSEIRGSLQPVWYGSVTTKSKDSVHERLLKIHEFLLGVFAGFNPQMVALERIFHHVNPKTSLLLGQARGVALLSVAEAGLPLMELTPTEVKRAVTGTGGASKDRVHKMVSTLLHLNPPPRYRDETDALAIAICCIGRMHEMKKPGFAG